jgi:Zn-dependent peptidase ImmA (M78 family)
MFIYSQSEKIARKLLDELGLNDPVDEDIPTIIKGKEIFYEEVPLSNKDGLIVTCGNRSIIRINSNIEFEFKKRFAAAHELGHFAMHRSLKPVFSDNDEDLVAWYRGGIGQHEIEANEFASEFLMPSDVFHEECRQFKFGPNVIEHLASTFKVSKTAAILKFVKRGNHPVMVVFCKGNQMMWWKASENFKYFLEFERGKPSPLGSVANELFTNKVIYKGDELKQKIWKYDWFKEVKGEADSEFYEYCLFVKSYNYSISIIWEE